LLIIQNWTFFSSTAWLPKRPILGRNRNLKGSPCLLSIYSLIEMHLILIGQLRTNPIIFKQCAPLGWRRVAASGGEWRRGVACFLWRCLLPLRYIAFREARLLTLLLLLLALSITMANFTLMSIVRKSC
jgi:hypothetical protein